MKHFKPGVFLLTLLSSLLSSNPLLATSSETDQVQAVDHPPPPDSPKHDEDPQQMAAGRAYEDPLCGCWHFPCNFAWGIRPHRWECQPSTDCKSDSWCSFRTQAGTWCNLNPLQCLFSCCAPPVHDSWCCAAALYRARILGACCVFNGYGLTPYSSSDDETLSEGNPDLDSKNSLAVLNCGGRAVGSSCALACCRGSLVHGCCSGAWGGAKLRQQGMYGENCCSCGVGETELVNPCGVCSCGGAKVNEGNCLVVCENSEEDEIRNASCMVYLCGLPGGALRQSACCCCQGEKK